MESENKYDSRVRFLIDMAYFTVIVAIVLLLFKYLLNLLMPFFLAFAFAAVVRPLSHFLSRETKYVRNDAGERILVRRRLRLNRTVAGVISVLTLFLVLGSVLTFVTVRLANSAAEMIAAIPVLYENSILPGFNRIYSWLLDVTDQMDESIVAYLTAAVPNLISSVGSAVTSYSAITVTWITSLATRLPSMLLNTMICLIATVFIAVDFDRIKVFIRKNLPEKAYRVAVNAKFSFLEMIWQFLKSYFIIFCITAAENAAGLWLIGVSNPILIGLLIGVLDAFPIIGSGMVLIPWAVISFITGAVGRGSGLLTLYVVITVIRQIIEPRIVGKQVGLRPVVTLTCMYAGTKLLGGVGLFALPIMAAILSDLNSNGVIHIFNRVSDTDAETNTPVEEN